MVTHDPAMSPSKKPIRGRGRPSIEGASMTHALTVRFPHALWMAIDEIIADRLDAPDKGAVVRELVAEAIQARRASQKR